MHCKSDEISKDGLAKEFLRGDRSNDSRLSSLSLTQTQIFD